MKQKQNKYTQFRSPFEELETSSKYPSPSPSNSEKIKCRQTTNCKAQEQWQPAFPLDDIQKQSPVHSESEQQSSQPSKKSSAKTSQSAYSYSLDDLSQSEDFSLSSQALDIQLESDHNDHPHEKYQLEMKDSHQITNDLLQVYQHLEEQGKGKLLSSNKGTDMMRNQEWVGKQDKIVAAKAFVNRGYGINQFKDQLKTGNYGSLKIDECQYKSVAGSMIRQSFRYLEAFLLRDCKQKLHSMAGHEMKLLQTLLLNCRTTLPPKYSEYFIRVVSITYNIKDTSIYQNECLQLYNVIHRSLMKKIALLRGQRPSDSYSYSSDQRPKRYGRRVMYSGQVDCNVITANIERQIISQYINVQSLSQVRDSVRHRYKIDETKLNVKVIRNILRRVMRATIRKIQDISTQRQFKYSGHQRMSDEKIKLILETSEGSRLRNRLCKLHLSNCRDSKQAEQVCRQLWDFVKYRGQRRIELD